MPKRIRCYFACDVSRVIYVILSSVPIIEKGLFQWLLNAKRECLPRELQNRGIFPDIDSIIRNKDVPSIRLWIAFMLEKFRSRRLFGWRMVDFLREAGLVFYPQLNFLKPPEKIILLFLLV